LAITIISEVDSELQEAKPTLWSGGQQSATLTPYYLPVFTMAPHPPTPPFPAPAPGPGKEKKKRKTLTYAEKLEVVKQIDSGKSSESSSTGGRTT